MCHFITCYMVMTVALCSEHFDSMEVRYLFLISLGIMDVLLKLVECLFRM